MTDLYRKHYTEVQFERAGLFHLLQQVYGGSQVLYPGCFVHLTPSFYFPHVIYVDQHPEAQSFFSDLEAVSQLIERNKHYRRSAYFRFIAQDFTAPLPIPLASFDLLISLFAGGIARACKVYLKPGGLLITNNHSQDSQDAATDTDFILISVIRFQRDNYRLFKGDPTSLLLSCKANNRIPRYLRQGNQGLEYSENEVYFLFRKSPQKAR